jgi:polar amino acid transport system substrate-binding protein
MIRSRPRARNARALLAAGGGLLLAGTMLVASLPGDSGAKDGPAGGGSVAHAEHADDDSGTIGTLADPEPEQCDDGQNPAASYRPDGIAGDKVEEIQERGQLIVGVDQNSYRWGFRETETETEGESGGDGTDIVGFDIDLVEAIAESLLGEDPNILYRAIPTAQRIPAIQTGQVDMVVRTMSITCERWNDVAFSTAYFETGQQLLAPVASGITGVDESLNGATVCSGEDTTAQEVLQQAQSEELPDMELVFRDNHLDCLVAVQLGQADALMTDSALAAGHAAQDPAVHLVGDEITAESYGVAMNLDDVDLVRWVNGVLEDYTSGTLSPWQVSYNDWLAAYMPDATPAPPEPLYRD